MCLCEKQMVRQLTERMNALSAKPKIYTLTEYGSLGSKFP